MLCVCKHLRHSHGLVCPIIQVIYVLREYSLKIGPIRSLGSKSSVRNMISEESSRAKHDGRGRKNDLECITKARVQYSCVASDCSDYNHGEEPCQRILSRGGRVLKLRSDDNLGLWPYL